MKQTLKEYLDTHFNLDYSKLSEKQIKQIKSQVKSMLWASKKGKTSMAYIIANKLAFEWGFVFDDPYQESCQAIAGER